MRWWWVCDVFGWGKGGFKLLKVSGGGGGGLAAIPGEGFMVVLIF